MMEDIYNLRLLDILPASISGDINVKAMAAALDPELQSVSRDIREALIISRIDELPETVLDLLAWQWHVDFYEPDKLPAVFKRALIKNSIAQHRKKGTLWAVKQILRDLGLEPEIHEWFEIGMAPYTFAVDAKYKGNDSDFLGKDTQALVRMAIEVTKPARAGLIYVAVIPEPPEIALEHGYDKCFYDECFYSAGWWPRPEIRWFGVDEIVSRSIRTLTLQNSKPITYLLASTYDMTRYDSLPFPSWLSMNLRERLARIEREEPLPKAGRLIHAYAQGVYDEDFYGSLNAVYGARYLAKQSPGKYDDAKYDDLVEPPKYLPIYRYFMREIPTFAEYPTAEIETKSVSELSRFSIVRSEPAQIYGVFRMRWESNIVKRSDPRRWVGGWSGFWTDKVEYDGAVPRIEITSMHAAQVTNGPDIHAVHDFFSAVNFPADTEPAFASTEERKNTDRIEEERKAQRIEIISIKSVPVVNGPEISSEHALLHSVIFQVDIESELISMTEVRRVRDRTARNRSREWRNDGGWVGSWTDKIEDDGYVPNAVITEEAA